MIKDSTDQLQGDSFCQEDLEKFKTEVKQDIDQSSDALVVCVNR